MSTSKVKKLKTQIYFTATWLANVLTVTAASAHNLVTGDLVNIIPAAGTIGTLSKAAVTVTGATTFTVATTHPYSYLRGLVEFDFFRTGSTGRQVFTMSRSTGASAVIHSFVTGVGGAVYNVEVSLDGVHWISLATVTHPTVDGDSDFTTVEPAWVYLAINLTSIGADTKLEVLYSA